MATRFARFLAVWLGCSVIMPYARTVIAETFQAIADIDPSVPKPSVKVEEMLGEIKRMAEGKHPLDALKLADQALQAAKQLEDKTGAALAQQERGKALQDLQRTDEALSAWQDAAGFWAEANATPEQITALVQAGLLCAARKKCEAEKFFAQGLSLVKSETKRPAAMAQALHNSGLALDAQGQDETAWDYLTAALGIWEKQSPESLKLVETLNVLAKVTINRATHNAGPKYYYLGRDYSLKAAEMCHRLAADSSLEVESLHMLGRAEYQLEDFAHGREHFLSALRIQRNLVPAGSLEEISVLRELGVLEDVQTNFATAQSYLEEAVGLGERLAPASPQFERSLENLANVEQDEGDLVAARNRLERALAINEKLHGNLAPTFINLGVVALYQSDFASARDYFQKALDLFTKTESKTAGIPIALMNLSETFFRQGDLVPALEYRQRSLVMMQERLGESLLTADDLDGMGDILLAQGKFGAAGGYYHRALDMQQKIAPDSLHVSQTLVSLAKVAHAQGDRTLAMEYDNHALKVGQKSCPNYWCVPEILHDLGVLAYEQGDLTGSENYLRSAVEIREKSLGSMHPDLARSLNALALTVAAEGGGLDALNLALRAERIGAQHLRISVRTLAERQAIAYESVRASGLDLALTLAAVRANTPSTRTEVLDVVIRSRALVFDELAARRRSAYGSGDPEIRELADQLSAARTRLANLVLRGTGDATPEVYRKLLVEAREKKEKAEQTLAERSILFRLDQARAQLGFREIVASLPQRTALVSFVRYLSHGLQKPERGKVVPESVPSYAAFVLRADKTVPELVPLGAAREIESLLAAWRRDVAQQAEVMDVSAKTGENSYRRSGAALRRRIWYPLVADLGDAREVFVVPDAALHLVSLASLPVSASKYLIETGPLIHYLSTERDLVPAESRHGEGILVVGNPAFDQAGKVVMASTQQAIPTGARNDTAVALLRGSRSTCGTFRTLRFSPLPASQQEAEKIAAVWKKSAAGEDTSRKLLQVSGTDASAEAFAHYGPGKRVLHVATHGFFLQGSCESVVQRGIDERKRDEIFLPSTAENPLLLSGLAFAGANRRKSARPDETDGILTAEQIAGLNFEGVDWAVLSACDTGVGEIKTGEGVFGLQRAFQLAGARTVIMSLWPVEDETTRQWMSTLYSEHFLGKKDTREAVRAASLQILRKRRARLESTHPFYWGAFIAAGDWH